MKVKCAERKPEQRERVLLYDEQFGKWVIARLQDNQGVLMWVVDPHLFYGADDTRFSWWQPLPENPNDSNETT